MFSSLYLFFQKYRKPSKLIFVNIWSYSTMNSWGFLSNELLTFCLSSGNRLKTVHTSTAQIFPNILGKFILFNVSLLFLLLFNL